MENKYYPHLFQKGTVGGVVLKNRIVRNSMGTYLGNPDGTVTDRQIKAYAQAADGGAGLIFMDNAVPVPMVSCGLRADKDEFIAGLTLLAETVKEHGAVPGTWGRSRHSAGSSGPRCCFCRQRRCHWCI